MTCHLFAIAVLFGAVGRDAAVDAKRATEELFRTIPEGVAAVAVLEDLDGFVTRLEQSEIVKRLRQSKVLSAAVESEIARRWKEIDGALQARVGVGLETIRKDVFGLSVALAYWPKGGRDEAGLFLVRTRSPERLDELLRTLFRMHGAEPPRKTHAEVSYWTSKAGEKSHYLLMLGPIGVLSDDEDAIQRVIQTSKGSGSWKDEPAFAAMRSNTPAGALLSIFLLPRNLDARFQTDQPANIGAAKVREAVVNEWKALEWASATATVESQLEFGLHLSVDRSKLPAPRSKPGAGRIPTQGLPGAIASFIGGVDVGVLADLLSDAAGAENPKEAAEGKRFLQSLFMGLDPVAELAPQLGPRFGVAILENPSGPPDGLFALELQRSSKPPPALASTEDLVEQAFRFAAIVLAFEANKNANDQWQLRMEPMEGVRVHIAGGGRNAPPGVEPCFAVHNGWVLAATSRKGMKAVLQSRTERSASGEIARLDLQALSRSLPSMRSSLSEEASKGMEFLRVAAEAVPLALLKNRDDGRVHHWTLELPAAK